jgi:hypothetical protein
MHFGGPDLLGGHTTSQTTKHQPDFVCTLGVLRVVDEVIDSMIIQMK